MDLVLLEQDHCFCGQPLSFCALRNSLPREGLDGSSLRMLLHTVAPGIGVTQIPDIAVPVEAPLGI